MKEPSTRTCRAAGVALGLLVSCVQLAAHDLWIEPSSFAPGAGSPVAVRLRVGVDLLGDPVARDPALIDRFVALTSEGTRPIEGPAGIDPAGVLRVTASGLVILGYVSKPSPVVLDGPKFNTYLAEEGLEAIAALRAKRGETNAEAREEFSRCAKGLLLSGPAAPDQRDRALGCPLELVAERNPYAMGSGQELPVRLLWSGRPAEGVLVVAMNKRNPAAKLTARSGKDGGVTFRLVEPGMWLVKAVHMTPAPAGSGSQWSSFWASLTFQLPGEPAARRP